jgi:hypothetical protein
MRSALLRSLIDPLASIRLTVALLVLSLLMVFAATLDQVQLGVWGVQEKYFHSFIIYTTIPGTVIAVPVFPGGYLLGGVLLANLLAAHFTRFRLKWKNCGIWLTHIGLILLLICEGVYGLSQRDSHLRIDLDQTKSYAESFRETELAVIDGSAPDFDDVVAIPLERVRERAEIRHPRLPFTLRATAYFPNATIRMRGPHSGSSENSATLGDGTDVSVQPVPVTAKPKETNWPTAFIEIKAGAETVGTVLVSTLLESPQTFSHNGRRWQIALRAKRTYFPFSLTLLKFTHEVYPGTQIPKDFASTVRLQSGDGHADRQVRIFMNSPLRYDGFAIYQAGYENNDRTSILQVVSNPSWTLPYIACALMTLGLAIQFLIHLLGYVRRRHQPAGELRPA